MTIDKTTDESEIICTCTGTTKEKINQLIDKGCNDLDKISSATGATTGCGSCDVTILDMIADCGAMK